MHMPIQIHVHDVVQIKLNDFFLYFFPFIIHMYKHNKACLYMVF